MINDNWITWQQVKDEKGHLCKAKVMLFFPRNVHVFSVWFSCLSVLIRCSTSLPHVFTNGGGGCLVWKEQKRKIAREENGVLETNFREKTPKGIRISVIVKKNVFPQIYSTIQ